MPKGKRKRKTHSKIRCKRKSKFSESKKKGR